MKRPSESHQGAERPGEAPDRGEGVVDLVREDADEPLPRLALFRLQRPVHVGQEHQGVGPAILAERAAPQFPAVGVGAPLVEHPRRLALKAVGEADRRGMTPDQPLGRGIEEPFPAPVHEDQRAGRVVEGEDGGVDLRHDGPHQRRRLDDAKPLAAEKVGERVRLEIEQPDVVLGVERPRAKRKVALPHRRQEVGDGLQRPDDTRVQEGQPAGEAGEDDEGGGPLQANGGGAEPEESQRDRDRREGGGGGDRDQA